MAVGLVALFYVLTQMPLRPLGRHQCAHPPHLDRHQYEGEKIAWEACGDIEGHPVECSTLAVPMDQFNATRSGDKVFTLPLMRMRGRGRDDDDDEDAAVPNLLLNPGGPGGSGLDFLRRRGAQLRAIVGEGFHLLTFDPRGVNGSTPVASCYPDDETRRALSRGDRNSKMVEDSAEAYAFAVNFARACADTMGEHGRYLNTPQTAADMNSILDAVGQADMVYWGFSYGTLLGQTYAGMFPERSRRVIIDGVVNQFDWYEERTNTEDFASSDQVFAGFLEECVRAGQNCSLSALSDSKDELMDKILDLADRLYDEPLAVYINNTAWGTLNHVSILYEGIFPALYRPSDWPQLADRLSGLLSGNATEAFLAYGLGEAPWGELGNANEFIQFSDGKSGPDHWPQDRLAALEMIAHVANASLFAPAMAGQLYKKQQWAVPRTHSYVPRRGVETAHPLLILSTTYDPICPLVSARSAKEAFAGSQIVEVKGYGHCSVAVASACTARHVRAFLYNGTVPEAYTQCEVDGSYFVKPEEGGKAVTALREFDDPEEMKIHMAQLELARDPGWPMWSRW